MEKELEVQIGFSIQERNRKLKSVYPGFKSISEKLKDATISPDFWIKERENIAKANEEARKFKESTQMSWEKFHQPFTI